MGTTSLIFDSITILMTGDTFGACVQGQTRRAGLLVAETAVGRRKMHYARAELALMTRAHVIITELPRHGSKVVAQPSSDSTHDVPVIITTRGILK